MADDEFEMVPVAPVRRLEREMRQMNQALVDQLATKQGERK